MMDRSLVLSVCRVQFVWANFWVASTIFWPCDFCVPQSMWDSPGMIPCAASCCLQWLHELACQTCLLSILGYQIAHWRLMFSVSSSLAMFVGSPALISTLSMHLWSHFIGLHVLCRWLPWLLPRWVCLHCAQILYTFSVFLDRPQVAQIDPCLHWILPWWHSYMMDECTNVDPVESFVSVI